MAIRSDEIDATFIEEMKRLGGESVSKCFQCGSCTAVCPLTSQVKAFPRRAIRLVQLGLRERAIRSPDMWLCSACGNLCGASCPRQADPGEVMAALRRYAYSRYSWLHKVAGNFMSSPRVAVPLMGVIGAVLFALIYSAAVTKVGQPVDFAVFLPTIYVDAFGIALGFAVGLGISANSLVMWRAIGSNSGSLRRGMREHFTKLVNVVLREVAFQGTLRRCNTGWSQWFSHLLIVLGFAAAALTTTLVFILSQGSPFPLSHPIKLLGNVSAVLLLSGTTVVIVRRLFQKSVVGKTHFQDATFLFLLFVVALTGTLAEGARLLNTSAVAYASYSTHLVSATLLLGLAPYTKFAHAFYRPLAMYIAKLRGWSD